MTREEIEKISIVGPYCFKTDREKRWYEIGCLEGLAAADEEPNLERLWHDAGEEPRCDELLLGEDTDGFSIFYRLCGQEDNWKSFVNKTGLLRWAYIEELLPKGGKK